MNKDTYEFQCKECKENFPYQQDLKDHQCILHLPDLQTEDFTKIELDTSFLNRLNTKTSFRGEAKPGRHVRSNQMENSFYEIKKNRRENIEDTMIAESDNSKSRTTHKFNRKNRMNETMINYEVINEETSYSILGNSNIETNTSFSEYYVDHLNKQEFDGGNHVSEQREIDEQFPDYFR